MRRRRQHRHGPAPGARLQAAAVTLAASGVLVLTWPIVRAPRLGLVEGFLVVLAAWAALIAGLGLLSRALAARGRDEEGGGG